MSKQDEVKNNTVTENGENDSAHPQSPIKKKSKKRLELEKRVTDLESRLEETDGKLRMALADYHNVLKEVEKQRSFAADMLKKQVFSDVIGLFTDLFFGVEQLPQEMRDNPHIQGITFIIQKYKDLLKKHGVTELIYNEGDATDHSKAEVVGIVAHPEYDNKVAKTVEPGYCINDVLIKPARILVYKKQEEAPKIESNK